MKKTCRNGHTASRYKNGQCIECARARVKRWAESNPQKIASKMQHYHATHPVEKNLRNSAYYHRNKEEILLRMKCRKYGISIDDYNRLLSTQSNTCGMCKEPFGKGKLLSPCVDHDHKTNRVRGIIHDRCNKLLGFAMDNVEILKAGVAYLD